MARNPTKKQSKAKTKTRKQELRDVGALLQEQEERSYREPKKST